MSSDDDSSRWPQTILIVGAVLLASGALALLILIIVGLSKGHALRHILHPARLGLRVNQQDRLLPFAEVSHARGAVVHRLSHARPVIKPKVRTIDAEDVKSWRKSLYDEDTIQPGIEATGGDLGSLDPLAYHAPRSSYYRTPNMEPQQCRQSVAARHHLSLDLEAISRPLVSPCIDHFGEDADDDKSTISPITPATVKGPPRRKLTKHSTASPITSPDPTDQPTSAQSLLPPPDRWSMSDAGSVTRLYISRPSSTDPGVVIKTKPSGSAR